MRSRLFPAARVAMRALAAIAFGFYALPGTAADLQTYTVNSASAPGSYLAEGAVEAVRQSTVAAQVSGRITELLVRAGDPVAAGQVLVRIDPSLAAQQSAASDAQVAQAQALLENAKGEYQRSKSLFERKYLSQAAMERADAQFKAATAQAETMIAQARAAGTQTNFHTIRAPYSGRVTEVLIERGDMAMPGRALITLFDPTALRVSAPVPESVVSSLKKDAAIRIELPGAPEASRWISAAARGLVVLPGFDAASHNATVRVDLPAGTSAAPGQFARVQLPVNAGAGGDGTRMTVPRRAVVVRSEVTAVYVVDSQGRARLRQVRLGKEQGDQVEVLAGLSKGERVALEPTAAAARN
jgi:RND family efflux transporter MFP subunit